MATQDQQIQVVFNGQIYNHLDLRAPFDAQGHKFQNDFNGYTTLRLGGILGLSRAAAELIAHPRVMEVADAVLKPNLSEVRVATAGPVGWTTSRYRFVAREEGEERVAEGNLTVIFVKQADDSYLAALFHASRLPELTGETGPTGAAGQR